MASDSVSIAKKVFEKQGDETEMTMAALDSVSTAQQGEEVELDWISELPDELLIGIVSRLTLAEAIRISVLSSRWIDLWKSAVSELDFDASEESRAIDFDGSEDSRAIFGLKRHEYARANRERRRRYMNWVNGVVSQMQQSSCSRLSKFRVSFDLTNESNSEGDIDRWLKFAISKRVESLHLAFNLRLRAYGLSYGFPEECYNHIKTPAGMHDIGFLRSLRLSYVEVRGEILEHFIANCPVLEELVVNHSKLLTKLKVIGSSHSPLPLKHLEVAHCTRLASVEIDRAPHLRLLKCVGDSCVKEIKVDNCPSLVDMALGDEFISSRALRALSGYASRLVSLFLTQCVRPIPVVAEHSNLERLTVHLDCSEHDNILGLIPLINVCPRLHTLQLLLDAPLRGQPSHRIVDAVKVGRDSIKVVKVVRFCGCEMECKFMEYVMEYFAGLERIVLDCSPAPFVRRVMNVAIREAKRYKAEERALELKSRAPPTVEFLVI